MGAMLIVLWDLPADPASPVVQNLHAFLGTRGARLPGLNPALSGSLPPRRSPPP